VRGNFKNGLGKSGIEVVALFTTTSFSKIEKSRTLVSKDEARINLQGMFYQYGKQWANLQIQWNGRTVNRLLRPRLAPFSSKPKKQSPFA
jgi:hypothetical protein